MVADTPLLFHGWSHGRRPLRTHRPDALVEKIAARVVLGDPGTVGRPVVPLLSPRSL